MAAFDYEVARTYVTLLRQNHDIIVKLEEALTKALDEAQNAVLACEAGEKPQSISRINDYVQSWLWKAPQLINNNHKILNDWVGFDNYGDEEPIGKKMRPEEIKIYANSEAVCVSGPIFSSIHRRTDLRYYDTYVRNTVRALRPVLPCFDTKIIIAVNVYPTKHKVIRQIDPENIKPKTFINAVTKSFGGNNPSNTIAYIASSITTDEIPTGGYLLVVDNNKTQYISKWEEWLLTTLKNVTSSKYEVKESES